VCYQKVYIFHHHHHHHQKQQKQYRMTENTK
jgi:hypothetical protein